MHQETPPSKNPAHVRAYRKPLGFWPGFVDGLGLGALWRWLARL